MSEVGPPMNKLKNRFLAVAVVLAAFVGTGAAQAKPHGHTKSPAAPPKVQGPGTRTAGGVEYWDIKQGPGGRAVPGMRLTVHYTGWLENGKKFESSLDSGEPITFQFGVDRVIRGWDEGLRGMHIGGERLLKIPPALAYGAKGNPPDVPPNATLIFLVKLLKVE